MTKAFIIHLERARARYPQVEILRNTIGIASEVVSAVDGSLVPEKQLTEVYRRQVCSPRYPFVLRAGEIGCFMSHRLCWQKIVDSGMPGAFIFEDDAELNSPDAFVAAIWQIKETSGTDSYVRLPVAPNRDSGETVYQAADIRIVRPLIPGARTQGQYVGRDAALKLLNATRQFDRPVDTFLQMPFLHKVKMLAVLPPLISEVSAHVGDTLIHRQKGIADTVYREAARPIYRLRVAMLNKKWNTSGGR
jgi:GR25 family glycosyltransferase involved in LPS biosynthesis